jgi:hypothetical protein
VVNRRPEPLPKGQKRVKKRAKSAQKHAKTTLFLLVLLLFADFQVSFSPFSVRLEPDFPANWYSNLLFAALQVNKFLSLPSGPSTCP